MNIWQQLSMTAQKNLATIIVVLIVAGSSFLVGSHVGHQSSGNDANGGSSSSTPAVDTTGSVVSDIQKSLDAPATSKATAPATTKSTSSTTSSKSSNSAPKVPTSVSIVNINTATETQLETLTGIGPTKAKAIIDYRTQNGPFVTVDDLDKVKGIGPATLAKIRDKITV